MSNYFINAPPKKYQNENEKDSKKKSKSQIKYINAPDIITQARPSYLNNFVLPINPHETSLTPSNHSNKLNDTEKFLLPPKSTQYTNKKTLILDLDETLVHSSFTPFKQNDIILEVDFEGVMYNIYVLVRPYAEEFLQSVSNFYEVIIFTASISKYASPLLDILDKDKNIKYRLFREHCTYINGIFIKDLKRLNRNLKDVIIVDNSPLAFAFDSENGLPIKTWYDDPDDIELMKIEPLILFLSKTNDVRPFIERFVDDNEILYREAMTFIKRYENNMNTNDVIDEKNNTEKDSDSENINNNNIKHVNNQIYDYKINSLSMMKNVKFNLFSFNKIAGLKNYNTSNNTLNKNILNKTDSDNENNKQGNNSLTNQNIKNPTIINENAKKENNKNGVSNNKKATISILLRKPSSKKKNTFRLSQKANDPIFNSKMTGATKNIVTNSFCNNYNNKLIPLVLPFSNTTKNVIDPKKPNPINRINIIPIHMSKDASVDNKKKAKYTNLLENMGNNNKMINKEIDNNYVKNNSIKISSSITNYQNKFNSKNSNSPNHTSNPNNIGKEKKIDYLFIPKSNSINNVLKFNNLGNRNIINNNLESKTPNRHPISIFGKMNYNLKMNQRGKKSMLYDLIKGIGISNTGRIPNIINSAKPSGMRNHSTCQRKKK
jgi:RNA polymerase II subunit A small phosphatase-like protein